MGSDQTKDPDRLLSVDEAAAEFGMGRSSVWLLIKRHGLARYRMPLKGKTTFVRRGDLVKAINTPIPITDPAAGQGKAAA